MQIKILAFGIAKDILGGRQLKLDVPDQTSIADLKTTLVSTYPAFAKLRSLALAVNQNYVDDDLMLKTEDEVVIIPPVSGG